MYKNIFSAALLLLSASCLVANPTLDVEDREINVTTSAVTISSSMKTPSSDEELKIVLKNNLDGFSEDFIKIVQNAPNTKEEQKEYYTEHYKNFLLNEYLRLHSVLEHADGDANLNTAIVREMDSINDKMGKTPDDVFAALRQEFENKINDIKSNLNLVDERIKASKEA